MTKEDITTATRIFFSHRGVKLFKNEPHKKFISGYWQVIKNLGYPKGSPDLMGWNVSNGVTHAVEIKTINDFLSKAQKLFIPIMINDNCVVYIASERTDGNIDLINYKTKEKEIIHVD